MKKTNKWLNLHLPAHTEGYITAILEQESIYTKMPIQLVPYNLCVCMEYNSIIARTIGLRPEVLCGAPSLDA